MFYETKAFKQTILLGVLLRKPTYQTRLLYLFMSYSSLIMAFKSEGVSLQRVQHSK